MKKRKGNTRRRRHDSGAYVAFHYHMEPVTAFAFLLGSNAVTATTGDITSVLFGVPGEGITAATIVDGHPMAKKGEAGRALGAALMSSLVGAIFGAFILALAVPIVSPLVLSIGSAEFFMLALLGITDFFLAIWLVGFTAASTVATFLYLKFGAEEKWLPSVVLATVSLAFFYGLFDYALHLPFPQGELLAWIKATS